MTRFLAISPQSQFWLFHFALALNILGMVLTDMWLPMVVGAIVTTYLSIDALVRVRYVLPMKKEMRELRHELERLRKIEQQHYDE
ncbi:hypothetical protein DA099_04125 [Photobacterium damselae]|uniref:Uncharacterized protein n=2 Tax=Photobacterium damselae TaxID=38293 RepID=A0ACD3SZV9_PHODM|nr:hypothetical protein [Photobacterium damselae]NVP01767.1 hypothetical protein [Photobacterium damselae subsp. damselae]RDL32137.1 hypothetical protein BC461_07835 [Photobacterium damselae]TMX54538.1 hypothetical protein DA099_04125 [Photobacterium damselae]TMX69971.1 hypothetical protein DA090_02515 [Photobacterium damselae]TMX77526.1 hypothetical protein DA092_04425 [Photobacterium damselae]